MHLFRIELDTEDDLVTSPKSSERPVLPEVDAVDDKDAKIINQAISRYHVRSTQEVMSLNVQNVLDQGIQRYSVSLDNKGEKEEVEENCILNNSTMEAKLPMGWIQEEKKTLINITFDSSPLGFSLIPNSKGFGCIVSNIASKFCFEQGLQEGDELVTINKIHWKFTKEKSHRQILHEILRAGFPLHLSFRRYGKKNNLSKNPFVGTWIPGTKKKGMVKIEENYLSWPKVFGEGVKFPIKIHFGRIYVATDGVMRVGELSEDCIIWKNNGIWLRFISKGDMSKLTFQSLRIWRRRNRTSWGRIPDKEQFVGTWYYAFENFFRIELRPVKTIIKEETLLRLEQQGEKEDDEESFTADSEKDFMIENYKLMKRFSDHDFSCLPPNPGPKNELWYIEDHEEYGHIEVPLTTTQRFAGYVHHGPQVYIVVKKSGSRVHSYFRPQGNGYPGDRSKVVTGIVSDEPKPPTERDLAKHWTIPPNWSDKCVATMITFLSVFYDFSAAFISLVDVTTDALVTREFYIEGKFLFFYSSLCIMLIAHLSFSFIFIGLYCNHTWTDKHRIMLWFAMVPFSQVVPLFIWIHSFEFEWFMRILEHCNFHTQQPGSQSISEDDDVLMVWIKKKFSSHGGFIAEACIEAFPQSILQMISIVVYHEHTTLNLISVIISMTAVASKSVMLSYNIDRRVFLFNFACFVGDIFNVFATIAWVFHHNEKGVFLESTFSWMWVYKICGLAFMILTLAALYFRRFIYDVHRKCCHPWGRTCEGIAYFIKGFFKNVFCLGENGWCRGNDGCWLKLNSRLDYIDLHCYCNCGYRYIQNPCCEYRSINMCNNWCDYVLLFFEYIVLWPVAAIMFVVMGCGLYIFAILASEIFKLGFFPLIIFGAGQKHRNAAPFYRYLFSFLQTSRDNEDCKLRLALTNQYLLEKHFEELPKEMLDSADALGARHKYEEFCKRDPTTIPFSDMYGFDPADESITLSECLHLCCVTGVKKNFCSWLRCECFATAEECYLLTIFGPYDVLTALFTIFFPIVGMIITPHKDWTLLQTTLTIIYLFSFLTMICLSIYVFKFFRLTNSVFAPIDPANKNSHAVDCTIAYWKDFIAMEMRNQMIKDYFCDVAPIILDFTGRHRVHSTSWVPPLNWKSMSRIESTYLEAKYLKKPGKRLDSWTYSTNASDFEINQTVELTTNTSACCNRIKNNKNKIKIIENHNFHGNDIGGEKNKIIICKDEKMRTDDILENKINDSELENMGIDNCIINVDNDFDIAEGGITYDIEASGWAPEIKLKLEDFGEYNEEYDVNYTTNSVHNNNIFKRCNQPDYELFDLPFFVDNRKPIFPMFDDDFPPDLDLSPTRLHAHQTRCNLVLHEVRELMENAIAIEELNTTVQDHLEEKKDTQI